MESFKDYNVLIVEDDEAVKNGLARILNMVFNDVICANNGLEALDLLKTNKIDLIITDLLMPKLNGFDLIKTLKESNNQIPIIVTTAYTQTDIFEEMKDQGVNCCLLKPLDVQNIISACKDIFSLKK